MEREIHHREMTPVIYGTLPVKLLRLRGTTGQKEPFLHWHDRFEMIVMDEGVHQFSLNGERVTVTAGDVVIINPGVLHEGMAGEGGSAYRVIAFELLDHLAKDPVAAVALQPLVSGAVTFAAVIHEDSTLRALADNLCIDYEQGGKWCSLLLLHHLYELLAYLCEHYLVACATPPLAENRLREVTEYITQHFCEDLTTRELCRYFGFEESYFCRLFRQVTGLRTTEYIRVLRLEKARRQLKNSMASVTEVALDCGFSDANYFARCFKKHYGMSAGDYRKQNYREIR